VNDLKLVSTLDKNQDKTLIIKDENGDFHFSGHIRNIKDVVRSLDALKNHPEYTDLVKRDGEKILVLFEDIFHHALFTGRSGTFFAYEGLGSIYWHMVSKLLLAVQETILRTRGEPSTQALIENYVDIRRGLSFNKTPESYGAFPTDPYSHTPKGQGAKQPGMSGMVKEEILTRQFELGYSIVDGRITFDDLLLNRNEFLDTPAPFIYWAVDGSQNQIDLPPVSMAYSICQVPIILQASTETCIRTYFNDGSTHQSAGHSLDLINSKHIFQRDGAIHHLVVSFVSTK
jgi:hypothetical protein